MEQSQHKKQNESILKSTAEGIRWLGQNRGIFHLMLSKASETAMGTVNTVIGIAMLLGSILASVMRTPKSRVKTIWYCLMLSMCTENFFLAFGNHVWMWCIGATLG